MTIKTSSANVNKVPLLPDTAVSNSFKILHYQSQPYTTVYLNGVLNFNDGEWLAYFKNRSLPDGSEVYSSLFDRMAILSNSSNESTVSRPTFNGTTVTINADTAINGNYYSNIVGYAFKAARDFVDILPYTADETVSKKIYHGLGSVPKAALIKSVTEPGSWYLWHADFVTTTGQVKLLNSINSTTTDSGIIDVTDSYIEVNSVHLMANTDYAAMLFANSEKIATTYYIGNGGTSISVDLGFRPQMFMIIPDVDYGIIYIYDDMRGISRYGDDGSNPPLGIKFNSLTQSGEAYSAGQRIYATRNGFNIENNGLDLNVNNRRYCIIAVRADDTVPTSGSQVLAIDVGDNTKIDDNHMQFNAPFKVDLAFSRDIGTTSGVDIYCAIRDAIGWRISLLTGTNPYANIGDTYLGYHNGWRNTITNPQQIAYSFKRAQGFLDAFVYYGSDLTNGAIEHNLGQTPKFIITKDLSDSTISCYTFCYYNTDTNNYSTSYMSPNSSDTHYVAGPQMQLTSHAYLAVLFGEVPGVSKIGTFTGTGTNLQIDCGFSGYPRLIMFRTQGSNDLRIVDTYRGIVTDGNDSVANLFSSNAPITTADVVDLVQGGFIVKYHANYGINFDGIVCDYIAIA